MSKEKISISEMVDLIAARNNFSKKQTEEFVKMLLSTIEDVLIDGEAVKIKDFGTFKPQWNEPRKSVNVNTGEEVIVPGYYKVVFTPESEFKEQVNKPLSHLALTTESAKTNEFETETERQQPSFAAVKAKMDPMRIFEEQANRIKDLLSEIEAMSERKKLDKIAEISQIQELDEEKEEDTAPVKLIPNAPNGTDEAYFPEIEEEDEEKDEIVEQSDTKEDIHAEDIETYDNGQTEEEMFKVGEEKTSEETAFDGEGSAASLEQEKKAELDANKLIFNPDESKKQRRLRKKREREERKKQRANEIKNYFDRNEFKVVREVAPPKAEESTDFSEEVVFETEPTIVCENQSVSVENQSSSEVRSIVVADEPAENLSQDSPAPTLPHDEQSADNTPSEANVIDYFIPAYVSAAEVAESQEERSGQTEEKVRQKVVEEKMAVIEQPELPVGELTLHPESQPEMPATEIKTTDQIQQEIQKKKIVEELENEGIDYTFIAAKKKKSRVWIFTLIALFIAGVAFAVWMFYPRLKPYVEPYFQSRKSAVEQIKTVPLPTVTHKAVSDSTLNNRQDTILTRDVFKKEREYNEFIASEVIKPDKTLKHLAKTYLGNDAFWIYIYEANIETIEDPKNVPIGTPVKIPKIDPRLINVNDPRCIPFAKKLANEYLYYDNK